MNLDDFEKIRDVRLRWHPDFRLEVFDLRRAHRSGPQCALGYRFSRALTGEVIFEGDDFGCSPLHALDSDATLSGILGFLTLRPGDTDADYFANYTPEQLAFAEGEAEDLQANYTDDDSADECFIDFEDDDEDDGHCPHGMFFSGAGACPACGN